MYGIWCISTEEWVGEYAADQVMWIPETYSSANAARKDLHDFTFDSKHRQKYEIREYEAQHMSFKVKCKKHEDGDGSYILSYGKGKKKITGHLVKGVDLTWFIRVTRESSWNWRDRFDKKRDAVVAWGVWAAKEYDKAPVSAVATTKPAISSPPTLGKTRQKGGGPPIFKRSSAPASALNRPAHPDYKATRNDIIDNNENPYLTDPTNPRLFEPMPEPEYENCFVLTELGALDEVFNWMQKNLPFTATLEYPWVRVTKVLQREFPDEAKYQSTGA